MLKDDSITNHSPASIPACKYTCIFATHILSITYYAKSDKNGLVNIVQFSVKEKTKQVQIQLSKMLQKQ